MVCWLIGEAREKWVLKFGGCTHMSLLISHVVRDVADFGHAIVQIVIIVHRRHHHRVLVHRARLIAVTRRWRGYRATGSTITGQRSTISSPVVVHALTRWEEGLVSTTSAPQHLLNSPHRAVQYGGLWVLRRFTGLVQTNWQEFWLQGDHHPIPGASYACLQKPATSTGHHGCGRCHAGSTSQCRSWCGDSRRRLLVGRLHHDYVEDSANVNAIRVDL